ncbi:MAG: hypothetical protein KAX49_07620 [Halanaerobiales bacterium]|nr:hypothetical protein [Halanaerobiales bacterium]
MNNKLVLLLTLFFILVFISFYQYSYAIELQFLSSFGSPGLESGQLIDPYRITLTKDNQLLIIDKKPSIQIFSLEGSFVSMWNGELPEEINSRENMGFAFDQFGNAYISLEKKKKILRYSSEGDFIGEWSDESFDWLGAFHVSNDQFYLVDNQKLMILNNSGEITKAFSEINLWQPFDLITDTNRNIYITDSNHSMIKVVSPSGTLLRSWGGKGTDMDQFVRPIALSFDQKDNLFVLDSDVDTDNTTHAYIKVFNTSGKLLAALKLNQINGEVPFFYPTDFVICGEKLFLVDKGEYAIKVYLIIYD